MSTSFEEALANRDTPGFRYDNTSYWKDYYINKLKSHDVSREKRYANFIESQIKSLDCKALDVATGYGFLPLEMQKLGIKVTCSDLFEEMSYLAENYFKSNHMEFVFKQADISDLPFEKNNFDVLTAMSIIEHFPMKEVKEDILPEFHRVIKPDGLLFIHVPVKSWATILKQKYRKMVKKELEVWACDDDNDITHRMWLWTGEYKKLIEESGFKVEYVALNFIRSNEQNGIIKVLNTMMPKKLQNFYKSSNILMNLLSGISTSVAFVCKKAV